MQLYLFNQAEELAGLVSDEDFISCTHTQKLTGENFIEFKIPADLENIKADLFKESNYIGFYDLDNNFQMFEIITLDDEDTIEQIMRSGYAEHVSYELRDNIVQDKRAVQATAIQAVTDALTGSRWSVGNVEAFGLKTQNFYYESSLSALNKIRERWSYLDLEGKTAKGAFYFRIELENNTVARRFVDFKHQIGEWTGKRFVAGKDLNSIKRKIDMSNICTAAYGRGKGEEIVKAEESGVVEAGDKTYSRRLTFKEIQWVRNVQGFADEGFQNLNKWTKTNGSAESTTQMSFEGSYSVRLYDDLSSYPSRLITTDFYTVAANGDIRAVVKLFVPTNSQYGNYGSKTGIIQFLFYNAAFVLIRTDQQSYEPDTTQMNTWVDLILSVIAPADAVYIKIVLKTNDTRQNGAIYFDSLVLGDPTAKPLLQEFVEDPAAKAIWGRAGGSINRMKIFEDPEETDARSLLLKTWQFVRDNNAPKVSYEANAKDLEQAEGYKHEAVRLGDLVYCLDENFRQPIEITARVMELKRDLFSPEDADLILGNFINDASDIAFRQQQLESVIAARADIWDRATVFEATRSGQRIRMVEIDGELQSLIRYEDDADPPNLVGYFSPEEFAYTRIRANEFIGQNIIQVNHNLIELYVDSYAGNDFNSGSITAPYKSLERLNNKTAVPKFLMNDVKIYIKDSNPAGVGQSPYQEHANFSGVSGNGKISIFIDAGIIINGSWTFSNDAAAINVYGADTSYIMASEDKAPVNINQCSFVQLNRVYINAADKSVSGVFAENSRVLIMDSTIEKVATDGFAVRGHTQSIIHMERVKGSNPNGYAVGLALGSIATLNTYRPFAGKGSGNPIPFSYTNAGSIIAPSVMTGESFPPEQRSDWDVVVNPPPPPPPPPPTTVSRTMRTSETKSWRYNYLYYRTDNQNIYQGSYGYGNHGGVLLFNNGDFNFDHLVGKNIRSARLWIKRDSSGGSSAAQGLHFYGHPHKTTGSAPNYNVDYGSIASIRWGEELSINLPASFLSHVSSGTIKGLGIYASGGSPYVILLGRNLYDVRIDFTYDQ